MSKRAADRFVRPPRSSTCLAPTSIMEVLTAAGGHSWGTVMRKENAACISINRLAAYLNDTLSAEEQVAVEAHFEQCASCESRLRQILTVEHADLSAPTIDGFEPVDFIASGGMGVVWLMLETELQRLVALKVTKASLAQQESIVRRFLAESQICGQLTHPGIVPVHRVGVLEDGRAWYAMKYIEGQTLGDILASSGRPTTNQLVRTIAGLAQAVAFAHARGVIHRDIKPRNVMVGRHGEVQLTDWGLAKALRESSGEDTDFVSTPARRDADMTMADGAMGTYAYMPPEQFVNPRESGYAADVFALGAILCEVLTGSPPFESESPTHDPTVRSEELLTSIARLRGCGTDQELIELTCQCLAPDPTGRPKDAGAMAAKLEEYLSGVEARLEEEKLLRQRQEVQLAEQRKRSRLRRWLYGSAAGMTLVIGIASFSWQRQAAVRRQEHALAANDLAVARTAFGLGNIQVSRKIVERADVRLSGFPNSELSAQVDQLRRSTKLLLELARIQEERTRPRRDGMFDNATALRQYESSFREFGADMVNGEVSELHDVLAAGQVDQAVLGSLDSWATVCMYRMRYDQDNESAHRRQRNRLLQLGTRICNNDAENRLRDPALWDDIERLNALAEDAVRESDLSPQLASLLAELVRFGGGDPEELLLHYQAKHRDDFWLNFNLARWLANNRPQDSFAFHHAALALRPDNVILLTNLGAVYAAVGDSDGARKYFQLAVDTYPGFIPAQVSLITMCPDDQLHDAIREVEAIATELDGSDENLDATFVREALIELRQRQQPSQKQ